MTNEEAISVLEDYDINFERHTAEAIAEAHEMAIKALEEQMSERTKESSVSPQPKTGHWIKHKHNGKPYFNCSECLYFAPIGYSYCPGCGSYNGGAK